VPPGPISLAQVGFHDQVMEEEVRPLDVQVTEPLNVDGGNWNEGVMVLEVPDERNKRSTH